METSLSIIIGVGCGILTAIMMMICFTCYHCLSKQRKGLKHSKERMVPQYEMNSPCVMDTRHQSTILTIEDHHNTDIKTTTGSEDNSTVMVESQGKGNSDYIFEERLVAEKAMKEDKTLLWTSTGQVVQGEDGNDHAIQLFISTTKTCLAQITELYMKESPCYTCSTKLVQYFQQYHSKPVLYLATIKHPNSVSDREGMRQLIQEGFDIRLWKHLNVLIRDGTNQHNTSSDSKYIEELKNETDMYCYYGIYN